MVRHLSFSKMSFVSLVGSVHGFLPCCKSNGLIFSPVSLVNRITLKACFMLPVKPTLSTKSARIKFFSVSNAPSAVPVPLFSLGGLYYISMFIFLIFFSMDMKALPLSDFVFSGTP